MNPKPSQKKDLAEKKKRWMSPKARGRSRASSAVDYESKTRDLDPMRLYLKDIETIPLLTADEERRLAKRVAEGDSEARRKMIRSNLRLVISIAKRYTHLGLPLEDLVEEGNLGLMKAVQRYNYKRGYRFSTYASWWIRQAIIRALSNQGKTIRIPVYMSETITKWKKITEHLSQKLGRRPTPKEVAKAMDLGVDKVKEISEMASRPSSLDAPLSMDGSGQLLDLIEDQAASSPAEAIEEILKGERVDELLSLLDARERQILELHFGLKDGHNLTLEETAKRFGLTRERVRQIESAAIRKLRLFVALDEETTEHAGE
ncbi:MAG: sigma-70 family RNA polymerase sigma factor [Candidatus Omnitrophica bacterium]|nr:sigma-70 family RNA polymerase sigma factor [Candidatus Omnitrophota bacterium]